MMLGNEVAAQDLTKFGIADNEAPRGLVIGEKLPNELGIDAQNNRVELNTIKGEGALVVIFFRGEWCPYCSKHLSAVSDSIALLHKAGASVVAITPDLEEDKSKMGDNIVFLYDEGNKLMQAFDVDFRVTPEMAAKFKNYKGVELTERNGQKKAVLPVPGTFVFNAEGKLVAKHIDVNYTKRSTVAWMLEKLN